MSRQIVTGIDIGTLETKVIIAEGVVDNGHFSPKIIGIGSALTRGVERGYVVDPHEVSTSVQEALMKAEKTAQVKVRRAYASFGGLGLSSLTSTGSVVITRADLEVTDRDLTLALEAAQSAIPNSALTNKKIINTIPIEYKLDGKVAWGDPVGLKAQKLEVKALFITGLEHHIGNLIKAIEEAGPEVVDVLPAPTTGSLVTVSKKQRRVGALFVDLGAETMSVVAYENGHPVSLEVFQVGSEDITNDIALGLKVSLEEAEVIKLGGLSRAPYSKKKLDEIVSARLSDCFELIEEHLKKIGRDKLLPAGAIISGGGSRISGLKNFAEEALGLPAQLAEVHFGSGEKNRIKDNSWAIACGLALSGFNNDGENNVLKIRTPLSGGGGQEVLRKVSKWFSQFLP